MKTQLLSSTDFQTLNKIDDTYVEFRPHGDKKVYLRLLQHNTDGTATFVFNNIRYKCEPSKLPVQDEVTQTKQLDNLTKQQQALKEKWENGEFEGIERTKPNKVTIDFTPKPVPSSNIPPAPPSRLRHHQYNTIYTCIKQDIPVYLVGDAGTGKNHTLLEIAEDLELTFYFTNSVQQEYKITGFIDAGGTYHETEFYKAFTNGGLFFLDELDASIPEVLVLLNAAIANRYFEFPCGRKDAHPDFRVVAAGNTSGSGANEMYTGRLVLDSATLDRFVEIEFDYDKEIELSLARGNQHLVSFIRGLREFTRTNGIRATFSYRAIISVTKLEEAGLDTKQILRIAVLKGLDKDTVRTLKTDFVKHGSAGKYYYALVDMQKETA